MTDHDHTPGDHFDQLTQDVHDAVHELVTGPFVVLWVHDVRSVEHEHGMGAHHAGLGVTTCQLDNVHAAQMLAFVTQQLLTAEVRERAQEELVEELREALDRGPDGVEPEGQP